MHDHRHYYSLSFSGPGVGWAADPATKLVWVLFGRIITPFCATQMPGQALPYPNTRCPERWDCLLRASRRTRLAMSYK